MRLFILLLCFSWASAEFLSDIERRRPQYLDTSGYFAAPAPYSIPGVGDGVMFFGMATNIYKTQTDMVAYASTGDVEGYGLGGMDIYLIDKYLKVEFFKSHISTANMQSYASRGMNSDPEDYYLLELDASDFTVMRTTASFYEKMLEFYLIGYQNSFKLNSLKNKDGVVVLDTEDAKTYEGQNYSFGFMVDYTDDRVDPRKGLRFDASLNYASNDEKNAADYYVTNYNLTYYYPIGKKSTWVLNYFRSDANVISVGETDYDTVAANMGLNCALLTDTTEKAKCESVINNTISENRYGSSSSLGGRSRLRSYVEGRFRGAHTEFYGTEFRWNITDEKTPFNIFVMKDIRTGIQTAFFYERGSVGDTLAELGSHEGESYGVGVRMVTGSGLVYRLDIADGDEGVQGTMFINYPWELF